MVFRSPNTGISDIVRQKLVSKATRLSIVKRAEITKHNQVELSGTKHVLNGSWLELLDLGVPKYQVGKLVLDHVRNNPSARAFVFFSLGDEQVLQLTQFLTHVRGLEVIYATNVEFTEVGGLNVVELCYGHKPWFNERVGKKMARERMPYSMRASIVLYSGWNHRYETVQDLKADLRSLLPRFFERRIHGTDDAEDTLVLVEAITNPNTLALINRVEVSRHDRVFTRVPDSIRNNDFVCIDGSSVMELHGLRKSRDLDFICVGDDLTKSLQDMGYDVNNEKYEWMPISADQVVMESHLHVRLFGLKFTSLAVRQLVVGFGPNRESAESPPKKLRDFRSISLFNLERTKTRIRFAGMFGSALTQLRLIYEFFVVRIIPRLPGGLVVALRMFRSLFVSANRTSTGLPRDGK